MSVIGKFKELFFEDEEVVEEHTRELKPIVEEKTVEEKPAEETERDVYKSEPTFKFPVIFEEEDLTPDVDTKRLYKVKKDKEPAEERKFVSSPIISPVYGILDKNYKKDQITDKSEQPGYEDKRKYKQVDVDTVRLKAFGTLEDDLEMNIMEDQNFINELEEKKEEVVEITNSLAEDMGLGVEKDPTIAEAAENYSDYGVEYKQPKEVSQKTEVLDDQLFDLVNAMYNKEEE